MASAAAAIDEAAGPKHVDESLWWNDSFVYLLNDLEAIYSAATPNTEAVDSLLQNLREHHGCLLNLLAFFKLPNSNSKSAVNCPRIIIGKHNIEIKSELRDMALQLSSVLALDEVQMYILVSRSLKQETLVATDGIESFLKTIAMQYFLERQCLLKCTRQLLMYKFTAEDAFFEYNAIREEANELLEQGLEDRALVDFKDLLLAERPPKLDLRYADMWAEETLIEESLIMDILFLLYYQPVLVCTADRWKSLLDVFKDIISGCSNIEKLAVTQEAQKYAQHVRYQAILVLIEALDLESLLYMVYHNDSFSQGSHAFLLEDLQEIDNSILVLYSLEAPESGLLIFTWAIFICLVCMLPTPENQTTILEIDHLIYIRQAYDSGTPNIILEMLQSEAFQDFEVIKDRKWKKITCVFNFAPTTTSASFVLRKYYIALLRYYEHVYFFQAQGQLPAAPPYAVSPFPQSPDNGSAHPGSNEKQPEFKKRKMKSCPLPSPIVGVDPTSSVDQPVTGVIDGKFDYGYLVTVKLGSDILRGVLYHKPTESSGAQFAGVSCLQDTSVFDPAASEISTCRKKKKDRIKKRDPDHPKPNRSGYNFFFAEQHARLKALHPAKDREISKMIGELWNKLNEDERLVYQDFGLKDKERYKREMQEYKERLKVQPNTNEVLKQQFSKIPDSSDHRLDYPLSIGASPKVADVDVKILSIQSGTTDINISAEQKSSNQENDYKESILKQ